VRRSFQNTGLCRELGYRYLHRGVCPVR
jgi:hypothetical protein